MQTPSPQESPHEPPRQEAEPETHATPRQEAEPETHATPREEAEPETHATPWVLSTYFAEGLPYSIVHQISAELFTAMGGSLAAIGLTSLYGLAWNLKFAWSPLVERVGTTRRWLIATEALIGLLVLAIARPAAAGDLGTVARILVAVAFLAATQDIAVDGFYLRALDRKQQTALSGLRVGAYRAALLVGKGGLVALAGSTSWFWCFAAAGGILLVLSGFHALSLPRVVEPKAALAPSAWWTALASFLAQPRIGLSLAFILLFRAGDAMMFAMSTPLLKDLGLATATRGLVSGTVGTLASVAGSLVGGLVLKRFDLRRTLFPIAATQSAAILLYAWLAWARPSLPTIVALVVTEQLVAGVGTSAFLVFLMRRCSPEHRVSHFAIATALMSVAATVAGSASGYVAASVGFTAFFAVAFAASLPGVVLSRWAPAD